MLRVVYSNTPEALLAVFAQQLEQSIGVPARDPFTRTQLVVASRPLDTWVKHQLAARAGVVANIDTLMLRRFVRSLVNRAFPGAQPLDGAVLRDLVLSRFFDGRDLDGSELSQVHHYLSAGEGDAKARELRRIQLATQIGYLFEEYTLSRRDMLHAWATAPATPEDLRDALTVWQRRLWRDLIAETEYIHLPRLLDVSPEELVDGSTPLFVFGLSFVGTLFHELLAHLAKATDVHLFALNPCMEFWEDLDSVRDSRKRALPKRSARVSPESMEGEDPFGLRSGDDCRALTLWGRPGRESIRLLNEATGGRTEGLYVDPSAARTSVLTRLQRDILFREPTRTSPPAEAEVEDDSSIEVLNAPSLRRECDAVAARIWALLDANANANVASKAPLRLDDLAVLIAGREPENYLAPLLAAFKENHDLPGQLVGLPATGASSVGEAAALLLELPLSRFNRTDVLRVLTHPVVLARHPDVDARRWVEWVDSLGIFHGADHRDHDGTYIEHDVLNWDQGLRRLGLGAFLTSHHDGNAAGFELEGEEYVPHPAGRALDSGAGELLVLARSLIADARTLGKARLPASQWAEVLAAFLETYLVARDEFEQKALDGCLRAIRGLADRELEDRPLPFLVAKELVQEDLTAAGATLGGGQQGGVRISSLTALRGIPARVIFVVGLSEGNFPSGDRGNPLDLRPRRPRAGDASPREKDEYVFLEALLCARERLVLSYVGRDEKSGEEKQPAPTLVELLRLLREGYHPNPVVRHIPLWRADTPEDPAFLPSRSAIEERNLRLAGQELRSLTGPLSSEQSARELLSAVSPEFTPRLGASLRISAPPEDASPAGEEKPWRISLSAIRRYLEFPLHGSAQVRLRLREDGDDGLVERADEPFGSSRLIKVPMLRGTFLDGWREAGRNTLPKSWDAAWERRADRLIAEGRLPVGVFLEAERALGVEALARWAEVLEPLVNEGELQVIRFGAAEENEVIEQVAPPVLVTVPVPGAPTRKTQVEVVGATQPLIGNKRSVLLRNGSGIGADRIRQQKELLKPFLDRVVMVASGVLPEEEHAISVAYADKLEDVTMTPITREEATGFLENVLSDLLYADNAIQMPIEGVLKSDLCGGADPFTIATEKVLAADRYGNGWITAGPVRHVERYRIPDDDEAAELFARRYALFARRLGLMNAPRSARKPAAKKGVAR